MKKFLSIAVTIFILVSSISGPYAKSLSIIMWIQPEMTLS